MTFAANKVATHAPHSVPTPSHEVTAAPVTIDAVRVAAKQTSDTIHRATEELSKAAAAALEQSGK